MATPAQFVAVGALAVAAIVVSLRWRSPSSARSETEPPPPGWLLAIVAAVLSSAFQLVVYYGWHMLPAALSLLIMLVLIVAAVAPLARWSRRPGWGPKHSLALATVAILTYGWLGIARMLVEGRTALGVPTIPLDTVGQVALVVVVLAITRLGTRRSRRVV